MEIDILLIIKGTAIGLIALFALFLVVSFLAIRIAREDAKTKKALDRAERAEEEGFWEKFDYES